MGFNKIFKKFSCSSDAVWPDFAIFYISRLQFFRTKVAQIFGDFSGSDGKHSICVKTDVATFWATFGKNWATFIPTSDHSDLTECNVHRKRCATTDLKLDHWCTKVKKNSRKRLLLLLVVLLLNGNDKQLKLVFILENYNEPTSGTINHFFVLVF